MRARPLTYFLSFRNCLIVEGGAKAAILPNLDANFTLCFENFVDAIIDLLIPGQSPGIKEKIVDLSGRKDPEVLFFGPDENTAGLMDWACFHARKRNAPWWKVRRLPVRVLVDVKTDKTIPL